MAIVVASSFQDFTAKAIDALTRPGPWSAAAVLIIGVVAGAAMRKKLTASWVWIPVLAIAMYFAVYRWLRLR